MRYEYNLVLNEATTNFLTQYKHIPATTGIPPHPYEGCTHCFIHEEAHTNVRFLSCDAHQLYERGVDLEVEGVRYIEMHRGPAAYVLGPPPSRSRDLELEGVKFRASDVKVMFIIITCISTIIIELVDSISRDERCSIDAIHYKRLNSSC